MAFEYRSWPISGTRGSSLTTYDDQLWAEEDEDVEASQASGSHVDSRISLSFAYRVPEAYQAAVTCTEQQPGDGYAWMARGHLAMELGATEDAIASFQRARRWGRADNVPAYVPE